MKITRIGHDLAKLVFQVHGVDEHGRVVLRKQVRRDQVAAFFAKLEPCLVGMEACGSAHHWARKLQALGHTVRLIAPQFVKPYVKSNKNDAADAEAICEAVGRPSMRFVPIKNIEQQAVLSLHRVVTSCAAGAAVSVASMADRRISPHTLRHTTAVHLLRAGVHINTIRAWLGHVSLDTTHIYAEVDLEMKAKALACVDITGLPTPPRRRQAPALMDFLRQL